MSDLVGTQHPGYCSVCEKEWHFYIGGEWLRDYYICTLCHSTPRQRALLHVLKMICPEYNSKAIHESSPDGPGSKRLQETCEQYSVSQFLPDVPFGTELDGVRSETLERLTFSDESFDIMITQDVFEHVMDPIQGFKEVARVLKPGGFHLFTVPFHGYKKTMTRARRGMDGIEYLAPKEYHMNPVDPSGSLVVTDWGTDIEDIIQQCSGLHTIRYNIKSRYLGIDGEFLEVFVSAKSR